MDDSFARIQPTRHDKAAHLITLHADNYEGFVNGLDDLEISLKKGADPARLERDSIARNERRPDGYVLSLVSRDREELTTEIAHARLGIPKAATLGREWQTPGGSYFNPHPLGPEAAIAFVYPGAFSSFPGMGQGLFNWFPEAVDHLRSITSDPWYTLRGDQIFPPGMNKMSPVELAELESNLVADPVAMLSSGTTLAIALTWVLRDKFGIQAQNAFGYSLGESSMLFSLGVWCDGDGPMRILDESPVFHSRLAGAREAVQNYWNLPDDEAPGWENYILMASAQVVTQALRSFPHVYMTHINAPRQVVIGGDPLECKQLISKIGCPSLRAPFDHVLHCPPVEGEFDHLVELNEWPTSPVPGITLFGADHYSPLAGSSRDMAESIGRMLCQPLDFPRLVEQAYQNGARVFIEVGAGSNCSRWIDECLQNRPHLSVAANRKGLPDRSVIIRLLARLASNLCPIELSRLVM